MSEPPSRVPPRGQPNESKGARDEISSKNKVEKVREVDADETRKRKFKSFLDDDKGDAKEAPRPSLFDISSNDSSKSKGPSSIGGLSASPSPVRRSKERDKDPDPLPQSDKFWNEVDTPEEPPHKQEFKEIHSGEGKGHHHAGKKKKKDEEGVALPIDVKQGAHHPNRREKELQKEEKLDNGMGYDSGAKTVPPRVADGDKFHFQETASQKQKKKPVDFDEDVTLPGIHIEKREKTPKAKESRAVEVNATSSNLPAAAQSAAVAATSQAAPYLHPSTVNLFFQMVGQIHVMVSTGVSRTEIILNSPAFANSRFFGSTITIEKYATAPDSFNIRLTGSQEAVASFKEHSASLMNSFQNGNFNFKIGRIDADYTLERPVYRRKEKGDGREEKDRKGNR